jgi:hypothetical protein
MLSVCAVCLATADKKCGKCNEVTYCSVECQRKDWPLHKIICNASAGNLEQLLQRLKTIVFESQQANYISIRDDAGKKLDKHIFEKCEKAKVVLENTLKKLTERLGPNDDLTIDCQFELARVLCERHEYKKSEKSIKECINNWTERSSVADHSYFNAKIYWAECHLQHMFREWEVLKMIAQMSLGGGKMDENDPLIQSDTRKKTKDGYLANKEDLYNHEENDEEDDGTVLMRKAIPETKDDDARQGKKERDARYSLQEQLTKSFLEIVITGGKDKETLLIDDNRPRTREYYVDHQNDSNNDDDDDNDVDDDKIAKQDDKEY